MKFRFIISRWANFYYFLHNLAKCEWPWPYRKWHNLVWKKEIGSLTKEEKEALKMFKKIYAKYFLKKYLGNPFFLRKDPWRFLKKEIAKEDVLTLKQIFSIWSDKFEKIYQQDLPNLRRWERKLELEMERPERRKVNFFKTKTNHTL